MTTAAEPALLTVQEAAEILRVSPMTVYRMIERDELPVIRLSTGPKAGIRIDPEILGEALAEMTRVQRDRTARSMRMRIKADDE
ncbi:MAG: Helix-turn-helix domain [Gaiellaceae bacterium]|jgi:excisionase family DNA binding protein|nr:Helix-turn-helix domain [Gaiellaceae bacterium]